MLAELNRKSRSYRSFDESKPITRADLKALVDMARICSCGGNTQALKYFISAEKETNDKIFPLTAWAKSLPNFFGPAQGHRPTGYILICADTDIAPNKGSGTDVGIAAQTIMLAAAEMGFGGCMLGAFSREALAIALELPEHLCPALLLALGAPDEKVALVDVADNGSTKYYRDENNVHCVPKRTLAQVLINE